MSRRSGLGRGLAALIPPSAPEDTEATSTEDGDADGPPAVEAPQQAATATDDATQPVEIGDAAVSERSQEGPPSEPEPPESTSDLAVSAAPDATDDAPIEDAAPTAEDQLVDDQIASKEIGISEKFTHSAYENDSPVAARPPDVEVRSSSAVPDLPVAPTEPGGPTGPADGRVPAAAATLAEVAPASIVPNPRQPREVFDPEELANLATSLADIGVLQPLVVRPLGEGRYELVAGERRLRAAALAGLSTVPVVIRHTEDADLLKEALVENIHRVQLNPLEEGAAYQQLLQEFGVTQEELAARLGRSRPSISNAIRLLQLPPGVQGRVASGILSAGHAKVLLAIDDPAQQVRLADRIVAEGMSVRATEELVRLRLLDGPASPPSGRRRPATPPGLVELQDDLADALEARVKISMGAKSGKLAIEFASVDDLERIVSIIANGLEGGREITPPAEAPGEAVTPEDG